MTIAAASSTNWADAMDFHAAMMCPIGVPAFACCALDGTLRTSTSNWCSLSCSSRCFQLTSNGARHDRARGIQPTTRSGRWWRLHFLHSTGSVDAPRARVARIARVTPHTIHTHTITQSPPRQPSRRRAARLGRSGAAQQRAIGGGIHMAAACGGGGAARGAIGEAYRAVNAHATNAKRSSGRAAAASETRLCGYAASAALSQD